MKSQSPANGKQKASTAISLTVEKDLSKIPTLVKTGAKLTDVETLLAGYGIRAGRLFGQNRQWRQCERAE